MKEKEAVDEKTHLELTQEAKKRRDALAVQIQKLRERFQKGIPQTSLTGKPIVESHSALRRLFPCSALQGGK